MLVSNPNFKKFILKKLQKIPRAQISSLNHLNPSSKPIPRLFKSLSSFPKRSIYNKDKFLDKSQYKPDENEYSRAYLKEKLDTETLTDEERKQIMQELEEQEVKVKLERYTDEERKSYDVDVMKNMLEMIEIESDPNSSKAKEFGRKMEEFERQNPNKSKTQVFIKTMKSGRIVSNEKRTIGQSELFGQDKLNEQAYNYLNHQFPEENYLGKGLWDD